MIKYISIIVLLLMFSSCNKETQNGENKSLVLKQKLELKVNECVSNNTISMCVDSVSSDSRCPMDVVCIWQGNAAVSVSFTLNETVHHLTLNTGNTNSYPSDTTIQQFKISLTELAPYPVSTQTIGQNDYRISLMVDEMED